MLFTLPFGVLAIGKARDIGTTILGFVLLFLGLFLAYKSFEHLIAKASKRASECCSSGRPVLFRWKSKDQPFRPHKAYFVFRDQRYANEFVRLNGLKVEKL